MMGISEGFMDSVSRVCAWRLEAQVNGSATAILMLSMAFCSVFAGFD